MQESFQFGFDEPFSQDDFIESASNSSALHLINNWPEWESNILLIYGPKSSGKTHLASIWQGKSKAKLITSEQIYNNDYSSSENYILDDIAKVHDEAALLHFFNSMKEGRSGYLLMTLNGHPLSSNITLADLRSRLNSVPSAGISDPDDQLLRTIFVKQFSDRQLKVDIDVINYLITRIERSFESLYGLVDLLDKQALKEKKNITIPFAKSVLERGA